MASPLTEIASAFFKLGCTSFGGPVAHLGYLRDEFVTRRGWLDDAHYADLVALCQFLPGPASSQVVFALGMNRAGLPGAMIASLCFTLPSAFLLILFAYGVTAAGDLQAAGWLHGLKVAAVAVVAQAVWGMGRKLCPDAPRISLALLSAIAVISLPGALSQIGGIAIGAVAGWALYRHAVPSLTTVDPGLARTHLWAIGALVVFGLLLLVLPVIATATGNHTLDLFDGFYRAGSLVFGGGHVILPLLRAEVVPPGWISDDAFLAGYGAAQAIPGPLFTFAAYLGTVIHAGPQGWVGGLIGLAAIFLPAWLLVGGSLPFWHLVRSKAWAQAALRGANASVVGVLLAALYDPVASEGLTGVSDVIAALIALVLLEIGRTPSWLVVALSAAAGQWLL
ncbi:chromate efflux transporter [Opitutaceae bacterium]|jgi:chromate transporter